MLSVYPPGCLHHRHHHHLMLHFVFVFYYIVYCIAQINATVQKGTACTYNCTSWIRLLDSLSGFPSAPAFFFILLAYEKNVHNRCYVSTANNTPQPDPLRVFHPCILVPRFPLPGFPLSRFQRPLYRSNVNFLQTKLLAVDKRS